MTDYDHTLHELGDMKADIDEEKQFISRGGKRADDEQSEVASQESRPASASQPRSGI